MKLPLQSSRIFLVLLMFAVFAVAGCNKSSSDDTSDQFIPVVTTNTVITGLTTTTAQSGGSISNFILNSISSYGVCYSSSNQTPTINDAKTALTAANAVHFSTDITGLTANTTYYLRAYASPNAGTTVYGAVVTFTTPTATFSFTAATSTFAGSGTAGFVNSATAKSAQFSNPQGIAVDGQGNMYVADAFNNAIRKISSTGVVTTLAGNATPGYVNATGTAAQFYSPQAIAVDVSGNVYVADVGNNVIRKITAAGVVTTLAGSGTPGYADATGTAAKFNNPTGVAVDASGNVYVADRDNHVIRKITSAGVVTTYAGNHIAGFLDGVASTSTSTTLVEFKNPAGVAVDAQGVVYVADLGNNALRQIAVDGTVSTLAGDPVSGTKILNLPVAVNVDTKGNIFVTDESGQVLELLSSSKILFSIAGSANTTGYTEGSGKAAKFSSPQGVASDVSGNVYVADFDNNVIRKLVISTTP